jgi:hypothetical protein
MTISISGIGFATAQGGVADVLESRDPHAASVLPWAANKWTTSRCCYPALAIDSSLSGVARWQALVANAFTDLGQRFSAETPLLVASCNGSAVKCWEEAFDTSALLESTRWANERLPVFSSSCASGLHALYAARQLLAAGMADEVLVLAADILSQFNHENFESLRVLAEKPGAPWQPVSTGFILGEAAVVMRVVRAKGAAGLHGPELRSDLVDHDGLAAVLEASSPGNPSLILGQGTGPFANDSAELAALSRFVDADIPLATPLSRFGHTLGASGLLAVALGALSQQSCGVIPSLIGSATEASDWRPLGRNGMPLREILVTCRALNGACAATVVGDRLPAKAQRRKEKWRESVEPGPLMGDTLKRLASEALDRRPSDPPDVLILRMARPLAPPASAVIGGRLLPSAVLEITPGFASQLIARSWGFSGATLCMVGDVDADSYGVINAMRESGLNVFQVNLRGSGDNRAIEWNA